MHFHFDKALEILGRTIPFLLLRLAVYGLAFLCTFLWFGGLLLLFLNWPLSIPAWIVWPVGGVLYGSLYKLVRNYVLYLVKAAHIAVITQLVVHGELPSGTNQLNYGKDRVLKQFLGVSVFFAVDRLVGRVIRAFNRTVFKMLSFIPGSGLLKSFSQRVLEYSAGYVDEAVLSYTMLNSAANPWHAAKQGLILYVQNWKTILGSGFVLALISYGLVLAVAAPGILLSLAVAEPMRQVLWGVSFGIGFVLKFAIMDPFALTSVIVNYHKAIAAQTPDPSWERKLGEVSSHFKEFSDKAAAWRPGPPPAPSPVSSSRPIDIG